jgi:integrase
MKAVVESFLAAKKAELRPASYRAAELYLQRGYFRPLHPIGISDIKLEDVAACLTAITRDHGSITAGQARSMLSRLFGWAIGEGLCPGPNPVLDSNKPQPAISRERVLTSAELSTIWNATCAGDDYSRITQLLLLTGSRRQEIGGLRWSEVDLDKAAITLPPERTKNKRTHVIPLSPPALAILEQARREQAPERLFVFGAGAMAGFTRWADGKRELDARIVSKGAPWRLHDLRRTVSTSMHDELGIQPHIVEAVLSHASGHKGGVAGVYNKAMYAKEKAIALAHWAAHVTDIAAGRDEKVMPLKIA